MYTLSLKKGYFSVIEQMVPFQIWALPDVFFSYPHHLLSQQMDSHSTQNTASTISLVCSSFLSLPWLSLILQHSNWILFALGIFPWLSTSPAYDADLHAILNVSYPLQNSPYCIVIACVLVYKLLDCQLLEGRDCVYLVHSCIPSTQHSAWHIVGA